MPQGAFGNEVHIATDLAGSIYRRGRSAHEFNIRARIDRRRVGGVIGDFLKAVEIIVGDSASDVEAAWYPKIASRVGAGRYRGEIVNRLDIVAIEQFIADGGHRARGIDQRLLDPKCGSTVAFLYNAGEVRCGDDNFLKGVVLARSRLSVHKPGSKQSRAQQHGDAAGQPTCYRTITDGLEPRHGHAGRVVGRA